MVSGVQPKVVEYGDGRCDPAVFVFPKEVNESLVNAI